MNELNGKVAVVTGGASGIGLASVEKFLDRGARVVIADINAERGESAAAALGSDAAFKATDVADADQVRDLISFTDERFGGLDIMFNNAGIPAAMRANFLDDDLTDFRRVMDVDLLGVMLGTQHAARYMAEHGGGSVINTTSIGGIRAGCGQMVYRAAKAGVIHFTKCAAIDLARYGVRVNCIAPGAIVTPILSVATAHLGDGDAATQELREVIKTIRPLQREGNVDDIAEAAVYFAGEGSAYVTGTVLPVDGGIVAGHASNQMLDIEQHHAESLSA
ncbi:SDR family NAD(P)-dependent oxidoreductase [Nocardia macrotermitis]|uniref:Dihydroanticapsin 7-dehydrogenase n=1 Tax=Nocardia macrotermitis TaxID=2585198 RepID=A0A7K0D7V2_9NOCA|nr:SDR family NAD(P)-dependent oxidoreductase [Nocardia macrotermitis]MQY21621.1 Dihydroanticapsin 7-dehydrogenase [Nocardia macrotermitis]